MVRKIPDFYGDDLLYLDLSNKHISNKLKELGMIQNKTFLITFPKIPINLYNGVGKHKKTGLA